MSVVLRVLLIQSSRFVSIGVFTLLHPQLLTILFIAGVFIWSCIESSGFNICVLISGDVKLSDVCITLKIVS